LDALALKNLSGLAQGIFVAGWAMGGLIFGAIGDKFGRAKTLGEACIGFPDAGAMSVTVIIGAMKDYISA
jgi:dihydroxyacetone kinase-like protein